MMKFNLCCSAAIFADPAWMDIFKQFHLGIKKPILPSPVPLPSMHDFYWKQLWSADPRKTYNEYAEPGNLRSTHKIWEYIQILYILSCLLPKSGQPRVLSLGAGVESPLWFLAAKGMDVTAGDMYFEKRYWHPEYVPYLRQNPGIFCPYDRLHDVRFMNLDLRIRSLAGLIRWKNLGIYDAIYSISSLEHVYGVQKKSSSNPAPQVLAKKIALFRRIMKHLKKGGVFAFTTELITCFAGKRRLDFFTREELEIIIESLRNQGVMLKGPVDWSGMHEQELPTAGIPGHFHTAVSLAFEKT
jgi:hypothetical protein